MSAICDNSLDEKLIAKGISPCFMTRHDGDSQITNYYDPGDAWYFSGSDDFIVECTVTDILIMGWLEEDKLDNFISRKFIVKNK